MRKFVNMNRTIISIEVQDHGDKEATILLSGEKETVR